SLTIPTKVKVQTYDGKKSWNTYLRQFEAVVRNWREEDKVTPLMTALRGEALESELTNALERRYGDSHLQHVYQAQLRSRRQKFEESLQQYEADISRNGYLSNGTYPTVPAETISEALAHALEIEAVKDASRVATNSYQDQDKKTKKTDGNLIDSLSEVTELLQQFQNEQDFGSSTTNVGRKQILCWTCGAEGHVRRWYPQSDSLLRAPGPSTSRVRVKLESIHDRIKM
ncbi:hypothetical protein NQ315_002435, partial [Exocentrus adspersus]